MSRRVWWFWRSSWSLRLTPLIVPLSVAASLSNSRFMDPYWQEITAKATIGMIAFCPAYAAAAAWDAGRFRALRRQMLRSPLTLAASVVAPAVLGSVLTMLTALAWLAASAAPTVGAPDWRLITLVAFLSLALALCGCALGNYLPRLFAAPVAFGAVWLWLVFPPTFTPFWVRNVTGNLGTSCCSLDVSLPAQALLAPAAVGVALLAGAAVMLLVRQWRSGAPVLLLLLVAGLAGGRALADDFGADPVVPRSDSMDCQQHRVDARSYEVCVWPENRVLAKRASAVLTSTAERLRAVGVTPPEVLTERITTAEDEAWSFSLRGGGEHAWAASLAVAPISGLPPACLEQTGGNWAAGEAYEYVLAWLQLAAGLPADGVAAQFPRDTLAVAREAREAPAAVQAAWFRDNLEALSVCDRPPVALAAVSGSTA